MSLLSDAQRDAIFFTLSDDEHLTVNWNMEDHHFMHMSGWHDYMVSLGNLDIFPANYSKAPFVAGGKLFVRFLDKRGPLESTFRARYAGMQDIVPFALSPSKMDKGGYDYIWSSDMILESAFSWFKKAKRKPTIDEIETMITFTKHGVAMEPAFLTTSEVTTFLPFPGTQYSHAIDNFRNMVLPILIEYHGKKREDTAINETEIHILRYVIPRVRGKFYIKARQYHLNTPDPENLAIAEGLVEGMSLADQYVEIVMALASKGLLARMKSEGLHLTYSDILRYYAKHITKIGPSEDPASGGYMRHPIRLIKNDYSFSIEAPKEYQNKYTEYDEKNTSLLSIFGSMHEVSYTRSMAKDKICPTDFKSRLRDVYISRLVRIINDDGGFVERHYHEGHERMVTTKPRYQVSDIKFTESYSGVHTSESLKSGSDPMRFMFDLPSSASTIRDIIMELDLGEPQQIPVLPTIKNKYISIHGVLFECNRLLGITYNTPLAGAMELSALEYDPVWLSYRDVRLMSDFLNGRLMPLAYMNQLSKDAFLVMSDGNTFIHLYYSKGMRTWIDKVFVLGQGLLVNVKGVVPLGESSEIPVP